LKFNLGRCTCDLLFINDFDLPLWHNEVQFMLSAGFKLLELL
jgi:hypothetical protein